MFVVNELLVGLVRCKLFVKRTVKIKKTLFETNFGHLLHREGVSSCNKVGEGFAGKHRVHWVVRLHRLEHQVNNL